MKVIVAGHAGFCYGVRRAVSIAMRIKKKNNFRAFTLGPLMHNPQMVEKLKEEGLVAISSLDSCKGKKVMVRTHGTTPENIKKAEQYCCDIIDATCPFVKKAHKAAGKLHNEGYAVFIVGETIHPEVMGIVGYANGKAQVLKDENELPDLSGIEKAGLVAQTTISEQVFASVAAAIVPEIKELRVFNTICSATKERQQAAVQLSGEVSVMIVVGGKNSANTARLAELCATACGRVYHIEVAGELRKDWFESSDIVGVTAGASTPDWIVQEVVDMLNQM